jgi:hypothetical protein
MKLLVPQMMKDVLTDSATDSYQEGFSPMDLEKRNLHGRAAISVMRLTGGRCSSYIVNSKVSQSMHGCL